MERIDKTKTTFTPDVRYFAQPYDMCARGFFFTDADDYKAKVKEARNDYGQAVEEFEIQFIDGSNLDAALFSALGVNQAMLIPFMAKLETWEEGKKKDLIIAVGECGYGFDIETDDPDDLDIDLYTDMTLRDLAYQYIDEGVFGEIPERLMPYLDYDAIARDLACDYTETLICGVMYVYRAA